MCIIYAMAECGALKMGCPSWGCASVHIVISKHIANLLLIPMEHGFRVCFVRGRHIVGYRIIQNSRVVVPFVPLADDEMVCLVPWTSYCFPSFSPFFLPSLILFPQSSKSSPIFIPWQKSLSPRYVSSY